MNSSAFGNEMQVGILELVNWVNWSPSDLVDQTLIELSSEAEAKEPMFENAMQLMCFAEW